MQQQNWRILQTFGGIFQTRGATADLGKGKGCVNSHPKLLINKMHSICWGPISCHSKKKCARNWKTTTPHTNYCTDFYSTQNLASQHTLHFPSSAYPHLVYQQSLILFRVVMYTASACIRWGRERSCNTFPGECGSLWVMLLWELSKRG